MKIVVCSENKAKKIKLSNKNVLLPYTSIQYYNNVRRSVVARKPCVGSERLSRFLRKSSRYIIANNIIL